MKEILKNVLQWFVITLTLSLLNGLIMTFIDAYIIEIPHVLYILESIVAGFFIGRFISRNY